ncbi:MAG: NPCBM/NEW2 domain-containing protein [Pirellulales bacterium]|nr:NPCBM/NEW2 domain-containing protein [Pirellulales bacterium]
MPRLCDLCSQVLPRVAKIANRGLRQLGILWLILEGSHLFTTFPRSPAILRADDIRYEGWTKNGERTTAAGITPFFAGNDLYVKFDNRDHGNPDNFLRNVLVLPVSWQPASGAWVEMTNGDLLPARLSRWVPPAENGSQPALVVATLEGPGAQGDIPPLACQIRPAAIRRVWMGNARPSRSQPGQVELMDGRQLLAKALRFRETGLDCLTESGLVHVEFAQLRGATWPTAGTETDYLAEGLWNGQPQQPGVIRIRTSRGAILSAGREVIRRHREPEREQELLNLRPNWTTQTLKIAPERIRAVSWRKPNEIPLSLLPMQVTYTLSAARRWPVQIDASATGQELRCGDLMAEWGYGTHAGTILQHALPAGCKSFSAWVGLDPGVGTGGCAKVSVRRDSPTGPVLWESDFLRGNQPAVRIGPLSIEGAQNLVLVVDQAHENRPNGADPYDIRDQVNWLWPTVEIDPAQLRTTAEPLEDWIPSLRGFTVAEADRTKISLRPTWTEQGWRFALVPLDHDQKAQLILSRAVPLNLLHGRVEITAAHDGDGGRKHQVGLKFGEQNLDSAMNGNIQTGERDARRGEYVTREWSLGEILGQTGKLNLAFIPEDRGGHQAGVVIDKIQVGPLITDLPASGQPLAPEIPLASVKPQKLPDDQAKWENGKRTDDQPLVFRGYRFNSGVGVKTGSELTFELRPEWRKFTAVIGLCDGWQGVGPYEILLDGQPHWRDPTDFNRTAAAKQIVVEIPPGHKTLTIKLGGKDCFALLGNAGFSKK